jgi:hypothetical protein
VDFKPEEQQCRQEQKCPRHGGDPHASPCPRSQPRIQIRAGTIPIRRFDPPLFRRPSHRLVDASDQREEIELGGETEVRRNLARAKRFDAANLFSRPGAGFPVGHHGQLVIEIALQEVDSGTVTLDALDLASRRPRRLRAREPVQWARVQVGSFCQLEGLAAESTLHEGPDAFQQILGAVLRARGEGEDAEQGEGAGHSRSRSRAVRLSTGQKSSVSTALPAR